MHKILSIFFIFCSHLLTAQKQFESDSIKLAQVKKKVILHINPRPDSALFYINTGFEIAKKNNYERGLADTEYLLAQYYRRTQQIDSALIYLKASAIRSEKENYNMGAAIAYNGLCRNLYLLAKYDEAEDACRKALRNLKTESELAYMTKADTYTALGTVYSRQDLIEKAQENFLKVDSMHQLRPLRPDVIAAAYQNLGGVYLKFNELDLAEFYFIKANFEFEKLPPNAAEFYMNSNNVELGKLLFKKNDINQADSILTISHSFFKKIRDFQTSSEIAATLSKIKLQKNDLDAAENLLIEAFKFHQEKDYKLEAANDAIALANLSLTKENLKEALRWSGEAQKLNSSIQNSIVEQDVAFVLANTYSKLGQYKRAMEFNQIGYKIKDSLEQIQTTERIREIEGKYQTSQRDREIELLKTKNEVTEQQKISQRNMLLGGIGLTTLAGVFLFLLYKNRQRTHEKLLEIDALKTNFFTNISHEFRTPLTLISSPIQETLAEPNLSPKKRSHFEMASRNTTRLLSLVDQLLDLSKIDSGNTRLQLEYDTPILFIAAWVESFSYLTQQKEIDLKIEIKNKETKVWFDKDALEKIVINLLGNAVKYTPQLGQIVLTASIEKDTLLLQIKNTGPGLTKTQLTTIFERFYQTDGQNDGAGIGLSLVKELVIMHKGKVVVSSEIDQWTTFNISLCIDKNKIKNAQIIESKEFHKPQQMGSSIQPIPYKPLNKEKKEAPILLIVEDNADVRVLVSDLFRDNYQVITAENGEQGIFMALEQIPDLIISDVMMPIKDGVALTKTLKEDERTSHIPIILLTAKAGDENKLTGIDVGADDYISKPFNQKILKSKATHLIALRKKLRSRYSQEVILKPKDIAITSIDEQFLEKVQNVLDKELVEPSFSAAAFSKALLMSRMQLHRKLKALTGLTTTEFIRSQRLKLAIQILKNSDINVSEVGYSVGFNDHAYFTKCFKEAYHYTPSEYAKKE